MPLSWAARYFANTNSSGAPRGAILTRRCAGSVVTNIATDAWPPESSTRYTSNVPAGTVSCSVPLTASVTGCTCPLPERNTGSVMDAVGDHWSAGRTVVRRLSSTAPGATVVSIAVVTRPAAPGVVAL